MNTLSKDVINLCKTLGYHCCTSMQIFMSIYTKILLGSQSPLGPPVFLFFFHYLPIYELN